MEESVGESRTSVVEDGGIGAPVDPLNPPLGCAYRWPRTVRPIAGRRGTTMKSTRLALALLATVVVAVLVLSGLL